MRFSTTFFLILILFGTSCTSSSAPSLLVAKIEWQSQPANGPFVWRELQRNGKLRGSPDVLSEEYADYMNVNEATMPEEAVADLWRLAKQIVEDNRSSWQDSTVLGGSGSEQLTINFCHEQLGWQMLSLSWPIGESAPNKKVRQFIDSLKERQTSAGKKPDRLGVDILVAGPGSNNGGKGS